MIERTLLIALALWMITVQVFWHQTNNRLETIESHVDTCAKAIRTQQYQIDVLTEYVRGK